MGYNTRYELTIGGLTPATHPCAACHGTGLVAHDEAQQRAKVIEAITAFAGYNPLDDSCTWYEHDEHSLPKMSEWS